MDVHMLGTTCGGNITGHKCGTYIIHSYHDWILDKNFHAFQKLNNKHYFLNSLK